MQAGRLQGQLELEVRLTAIRWASRRFLTKDNFQSRCILAQRFRKRERALRQSPGHRRGREQSDSRQSEWIRRLADDDVVALDAADCYLDATDGKVDARAEPVLVDCDWGGWLEAVVWAWSERRLRRMQVCQATKKAMMRTTMRTDFVDPSCVFALLPCVLVSALTYAQAWVPTLAPTYARTISSPLTLQLHFEPCLAPHQACRHRQMSLGRSTERKSRRWFACVTSEHPCLIKCGWWTTRKRQLLCQAHNERVVA